MRFLLPLILGRNNWAASSPTLLGVDKERTSDRPLNAPCDHNTRTGFIRTCFHEIKAKNRDRTIMNPFQNKIKDKTMTALSWAATNVLFFRWNFANNWWNLKREKSVLFKWKVSGRSAIQTSNFIYYFFIKRKLLMTLKKILIPLGNPVMEWFIKDKKHNPIKFFLQSRRHTESCGGVSHHLKV